MCGLSRIIYAYLTWVAMWDRFCQQQANIGITQSCMRWYVRKNYLTWVKTTQIPIWYARKFYLGYSLLAVNSPISKSPSGDVQLKCIEISNTTIRNTFPVNIFKWATIRPPAKLYLNGVSLAGRLWPHRVLVGNCDVQMTSNKCLHNNLKDNTNKILVSDI